MDKLITALGDEITDTEEDASVVFSQSIPSQDLGFVDPKTSTLNLTVAGADLQIQQSPTILKSDRKEGTTGAVLWKVTPLFAEWISDSQNLLFRTGILDSSSTIFELGCGVSGVVALALGRRVGQYIATDQEYVLKLLRQNIAENVRQSRHSITSQRSAPKSGRRHAHQEMSNVQAAALDWESDVVATVPLLRNTDRINALIACDCVYNDALVQPFVDTCADICRLSSKPPSTVCIVAQQLRSFEVFELWLRAFHQRFRVWRLNDELLTGELKDGSGYVVHLGILR